VGADHLAAVVVDAAVQQPVRRGEHRDVDVVGVGRPPVAGLVEVHVVVRDALVLGLARGPDEERVPVEGHPDVVVRERVPPEVVLARPGAGVPVQEAVRDGGAEEADEGLRLVPSHGVADERHVLAAHGGEERARVERRQRAPVRRLPPPVEVPSVRPPVADAVVALLHVALGSVVPPGVARRPHPVPHRVVAAPLGIFC